MNKILILINSLFILILSQFFANFTIFRFPVLILLLSFVILGIIIGIYLSFQTNEYVIPHLEPNFDSNLSKHELRHLNYSLYTDLNQVLNASTKNQTRKNSKKKKNESLTQSISNLLLLNENIYADKRESYKSICSEDILCEEYDDQSLFELNDETNNFLTRTIDPLLDSQLNSKLDTYIDEIIELVVRDFVMYWLGGLIWERDKFSEMAKAEMTQLIGCFKIKLKNLDFVKLISRDLVTIFRNHHLNAKKCSNSNQKFDLNSYEQTTEKEHEHLRNVLEIMILSVFKDKLYFRNDALRALIREVLVFKVLYPTLEMLSDPDYLNQKLINYITSKENIHNSLNRKFSYAATYEDFIKMIKTSNSVEELTEFHYKIMNELMQATILRDFKTSKKNDNINPSSSTNQVSGIINCGSSSFYVSFSDHTADPSYHEQHVSKSGNINSDKVNKGDMLRSKDLKKFIKQLKYAKNLCQKRLNGVNSSYLEDEETFEKRLKNRKILPFDTILKSKIGIVNFLKFLEHDGSDALLRFWIDVEKMKKLRPENIKHKYKLANQIYESYIKTYDSPVEDEIGKDLHKSMQLFLIGNNSEECFYKAQEKIRNVLESDHYPSFLITERYEKFASQIEIEEDDEVSDISNFDSKASLVSSSNPNSSIDITIKQFNELKEKLNIKLSALEAMKSNTVDDSKRRELLEKDILKLQHEISLYQSHIQKTELWCDYIGKWTTNLTQAYVINDENNPNEKVLRFEIQVKLHDNSIEREMLKDNKMEGWVIYKTFKEFEQLNESLSDLITSQLKDKFKKILINYKKSLTSKKTEERMKNVLIQLDEYLKTIAEDDSLTQSDALYTFLCPSRDTNSKAKKSINNHEDKFSISSIFRSKSKEAEDEFLDEIFLDPESRSLESNDSIAEPFYTLIEEVFDLKGMKKFFRKSLILFVQLTFGGTINRKIRETIYWTINDDQLSFYLKQIKDSFWTLNEEDGTISLIKYEGTKKTNEDKIRTMKISRHKLKSNIPESLQKLVGEKNSQIGVIKLFEMFQNKKLNKHLVYNLMDMFMGELFP